MADHDERWVLKHLIEMCKDEELTLRYAADHVREPTAKTLLMGLASQRAQFAADLLPHAQRLGGAVAGDGTIAGTLRRARLVLKATLSRSRDRAMITEAEHNEAIALDTYEHALADMLPLTARDMVERQCAEIRLAHDRVQGFLSH